jgi:hypothetical protein
MNLFFRISIIPMESKVDSPLTNITYVKILNESMVHNKFKYKLGLNTDHIPFNPSGSGEPGGLYFTDLDNFYKFLEYGTLIADVKVPEGVEIYADPVGDNAHPYKWKAPSIIISNVRSIKDLPQWNDLSFWLAAVRQNGNALKLVPENLKTAEMCLAAVQKNGEALYYVPKVLKTAELCLIAVQQNEEVLMYVPDEFKTEEICLIAVQQNGLALNYVPDRLRTEEICLAAVRQDGLALYYVPSKIKTADICLAAVQKNGNALRFVPDRLKTEKLYLAAVQQNGRALCYVPGNLTHKVTGLHYSKK